MIDVGDTWPDANVFAAPGEPVTLRDAPEGSRALFVFYSFDFSSTGTSELELLRVRSAEFESTGVRPRRLTRLALDAHRLGRRSSI